MKKHNWNIVVRHRLLIFAILFLGLIASICFYAKVRYINQYDRASNEVGRAQISRLIVQAVSALKVDAPVNPQSGAAYFPEARLYVPGSMPSDHLIYLYNPDMQKPGISVSSQALLNRDINKMYVAQDMDGVFAVVPHLQTCLRGVRLSYAQANSYDGAEFRQAAKLSNGKTIYLYAEPGCPQLSGVIDKLKKVDSY